MEGPLPGYLIWPCAARARLRLNPLPYASRSWGCDNTILAGALCFVERGVDTTDDSILRLSCCPQSDSSAEGDQQPFVIVQEELLGQFALQSGGNGDGVIQLGIGQEDDELLATKSGDDIAGPYGLLDYAHEVHQCVVACLVAQAVVELLEVVDIDQGDREWRVLPVRSSR